MNHFIMTLPFIIFSVVIVYLLAHTDPRRKQLSNKTNNTATNKSGRSVFARKLLAWSLVLPFIPLVLMANYAGILMYAGAITVIGWAVSELPTSVV